MSSECDDSANGKYIAAMQMLRLVAIVVTIVTLAGLVPARAEPKLPRFASVRAGEANVRTGPGVRYPVEWVFVYRDMPVEIVASHDTWRKIRDWEGTEGWVHQSMLSGRRSVIVVGGRRPMRRIAAKSSELVAEVDERVIGRLIDCIKSWCRVDIAGFRGWMRRSYLWGVGGGDKLD